MGSQHNHPNMGGIPEKSGGHYESITQRNQKESPLLQLPAELRNKIYTHAFDHATVLNATGFRPSSSKGYRSPSSRIYEDSSRLRLVCRQLFHEASPFLGSYTYLTLKTLEHTRYPGDLDYIVSIAGMLPSKSRSSLKSISLSSRKFDHCSEYTGALFQEKEQFPALRRIDVCCEGIDLMRSFWRDCILYEAREISVDVCIASETDEFVTVWTLARFGEGEPVPEWRKTRGRGERRALRTAVEDHRKDTLPRATAREEVRQRRVPRVKKLLHKLLCARAEQAVGGD